jgi:hypothetical protein
MRQGESGQDDCGIYQRLFAGASSTEQLHRAIALAVSELRAAMEKEANPAVTLAHMRNLDDLDPEALAEAYARAEQNCIYWPAPGQIRELAGKSVEQRAAESLEKVFLHLEEHGTAGRAKSGAVTFGDDGTGRRVLLAAEPASPAPELPPVTQRTLTVLGSGSAKHGLLYLSQHPRIRGWDEVGGEAAAKSADRIERQWVRCYRQVLREQQQVQTTSKGAE